MNLNAWSGLLAGMLLLAADMEDPRLNTWGWTVMILSVGSVLTLVSFCMFKVLTLPPVEEEHIKGPLEIETPDTKDPN